jgi:oxalate decarboxylase
LRRAATVRDTRHSPREPSQHDAALLEIFRSDHYADVSLSQWLAFTPHKLVRAHLNVEESFLDKVSERKTPVVAGEIRTKA